MQLPHLELDALDILPFGAGKSEDEVVIVRPQPILEEARRHAEVDDRIIHALKLHPPEPAGEDVLAQLRA